MIDLHSHILPQVDDGSRSTEESLQMLTALAAQGVTDVAATPHFYASENGPDRFLARRARSWQQLRPHLTASLPRVHLGAEVLFFEGIAAFDGLPRLCLSGADTLLLEMPFRPWSRRMLDELLELADRPDVTVLLAHMERYLPYVAEPEPAYVSPIDFASLQERCPDIYAWLEIPDTDISYPVAQNADDTWYLTRDIDGNYSSDGTLFTESAYNGTDLTDPATVIYGHRMNSGAMFGTLQKTYSDPESFEAHREIVLYLPDQEIHATVFAAVPYDNRHILYNYDFDDQRMTRLFLNSVERGIRLMQGAGVGAQVARQDTDSEICLTVRIPKTRRPAAG